MRNRETKLAVLDCVKMELKGYEGRHHCQTVRIEPDEETTAEFLKEAIEEIRVESDMGRAIAQEKKDKQDKITNKRHADAKVEYASWFVTE